MPKAPRKVRLTQAVVTIFEDGGPDWLCLIRGTRDAEPPRQAKAAVRRQRRREGRA